MLKATGMQMCVSRLMMAAVCLRAYVPNICNVCNIKAKCASSETGTIVTTSGRACRFEFGGAIGKIWCERL